MAAQYKKLACYCPFNSTEVVPPVLASLYLPFQDLLGNLLSLMAADLCNFPHDCSLVGMRLTEFDLLCEDIWTF